MPTASDDWVVEAIAQYRFVHSKEQCTGRSKGFAGSGLALGGFQQWPLPLFQLSLLAFLLQMVSQVEGTRGGPEHMGAMGPFFYARGAGRGSEGEK